jgi:hypothetical protein
MTKVSYIIECLKGNLLSNLDAKSNLITIVKCKCECGNIFDLQIGNIEVQGKWCDHSGIRENNRLVMSKNNFYSRLIYAIANYLINGVIDCTKDELFYHTVLPDTCIVIGYVPLNIELDSDTLAEEGINSLLFGFEEMVEINYSNLKDYIYQFITSNDIQIHYNASATLNGFLGSAFTEPNIKLIRLAMNYTSYEDYKAKEELSKEESLAKVTVIDDEHEETTEEYNKRMELKNKKDENMSSRLSKLIALSKPQTVTDDTSNLMKNMLDDE